MRFFRLGLVVALSAMMSVAALPASASQFLDIINGDLQGIGDLGVSADPGPSEPAPIPGPSSSRFKRQTVPFATAEAPGTIIIHTGDKFLYLVLPGGKAIRYGIGVGKEGFGWHGVVHVGRKAVWPAWQPPPEMIARERQRGHMLPEYVAGGPQSPLGARALYLFDGFFDNGYRIHGTTEPWSIGHNVSSGCIRMVNNDVIDLYNRVPVGTKVIVQ